MQVSKNVVIVLLQIALFVLKNMELVSTLLNDAANSAHCECVMLQI